MGRPLRSSAGGIVYHVLNRRVLRLDLFDDDDDYLAFVRVLAEAMDHPRAPELYAFCLMPNHWHLLVRPAEDGDLSTWMQWLTVTHTHRWHGYHHTRGTGPVYQGRFKSFPVQTDDHFLTVARYIERNPLRARLIRGNAALWRWSSLWLRSRTRRRQPTPEELQLKSGLDRWPVNRPMRWINRVNQPETEDEVAALLKCVNRGCPYGNARWSSRMVEKLGLASTIRPRGRPVKQNNST